MSKITSGAMKLTASLMLVIILFVSLVSASLAWFVMHFELEQNDEFYASSIATYFAGGDGTKEEPYLIAESKHLYNLAWLQYLGVFNRVDGSGNIEKQFYFKMLNDVDMQGLIIPPIGTEENPFVGNFDGASFKISNAVISNYIGGEGGIEYAPASVKTINNTINIGGTETEASIIGFFGVVGNWDGSIKGLNDDSTIVDIPSKVNSVYNLFLENLVIRSDTDQSLMGLLAGYVDASIQNIGVGGTSSIVVGENVKALNLAGIEMQALVSKYSLIGQYDEADVSWPDKPVRGGWGGSIDMANLFTRITDILFSNLSNSTLNSTVSDYNYITEVNVYLDENGNKIRTDTVAVDSESFFTVNSGSAGNYLVSKTKSTNWGTTITPSNKYMYLYGNVFKQTVNTFKMADLSYSVFTVSSSSTRYLSINNNKNGLTNSNNATSATKWFMTEEGYLGTYSDDAIYYFNVINNGNNYSVEISTVPRTAWRYSSNQFRATDSGYYLRYSSGWTINRTSGTNVTRTDSGTLEFTANKFIDTKTQYYEDENNKGSWFPLAVNEETGEVANWNTGYIVSGSYEHPNDFPYKSGSIRVSEYEIGDISGSTTSVNRVTTLDSNKIRTISYKNQSFGNVGATTQTTDNAGNTVYTLTTNVYGHEKFEHSFASISETINGESDIYGLHFMDAQIDINSTIRIDRAVLLNNTGGYDEYFNYELPRNAITFDLSERGFIDFYAGTYFDGNTSFFSLYKIERDEQHDIDTIREISKIYGVLDADGSIDVTKEYVYQYKGESFEVPSGYTMIFDTTWITAPSSWTNDCVYYFEIPVNAGEYALGSVKGSDGAYLLYLDLAASGNKKVTTTPAHSINGINFADANALANRSIEDYPIVTMSAQIDNEVHGEMTVAYYRPSVKVVEYQVDGDITVQPIAETGASVSSVDNLITVTTLLPLSFNNVPLPDSANITFRKTRCRDDVEFIT